MNDESDITVLLNKGIVLSMQAEKKESPLEYELFADLFLQVRMHFIQVMVYSIFILKIRNNNNKVYSDICFLLDKY